MTAAGSQQSPEGVGEDHHTGLGFKPSTHNSVGAHGPARAGEEPAPAESSAGVNGGDQHPLPGTPSPVKDANAETNGDSRDPPHHASPMQILFDFGLLRGRPMSDKAQPIGPGIRAVTPEQLVAGTASRKPSRNSRRAHNKVPTGDAGQADTQDCIACWAAARTVIFQPCGHFCCCAACADPVMNDGEPCPMCRGSVSACIAMDRA